MQKYIEDLQQTQIYSTAGRNLILLGRIEDGIKPQIHNPWPRQYWHTGVADDKQLEKQTQLQPKQQPYPTKSKKENPSQR